MLNPQTTPSGSNDTLFSFIAIFGAAEIDFWHFHFRAHIRFFSIISYNPATLEIKYFIAEGIFTTLFAFPTFSHFFFLPGLDIMFADKNQKFFFSQNAQSGLNLLAKLIFDT